MPTQNNKHFVSLGLFLLDEFEFLDLEGNPTGKTQPTQIGGGTYTTVGARIWLPATDIGQIVDRGIDFPSHVQQELDHYGSEMWHFRDQTTEKTARAMNRHRGELRVFDYLTPRIRLSPKDLAGTPLESPKQIHFVCSPERASQILHDADVYGLKGWVPFTIYEPIPSSCVPEELSALKLVLNRIDILSPNAEEVLGLLSMDKAGVDTPSAIETAAATLLSFGLGRESSGHVIIRCGALGAYGATMSGGVAKGWWIPAYWTPEDEGAVVEVTGWLSSIVLRLAEQLAFLGKGAGNSFLGGLSAGLLLANGDVREAALYATISAAYTIQQAGLPRVEYQRNTASGDIEEFWNGDLPRDRLGRLRNRLK